LSEAPSFGKPIILYDAICIGTRNYMELAKEVLKNNKFFAIEPLIHQEPMGRM
jgi:chromosome partitioning protein